MKKSAQRAAECTDYVNASFERAAAMGLDRDLIAGAFLLKFIEQQFGADGQSAQATVHLVTAYVYDLLGRANIAGAAKGGASPGDLAELQRQHRAGANALTASVDRAAADAVERRRAEELAGKQ